MVLEGLHCVTMRRNPIFMSASSSSHHINLKKKWELSLKKRIHLHSKAHFARLGSICPWPSFCPLFRRFFLSFPARSLSLSISPLYFGASFQWSLSTHSNTTYNTKGKRDLLNIAMEIHFRETTRRALPYSGVHLKETHLDCGGPTKSGSVKPVCFVITM